MDLNAGTAHLPVIETVEDLGALTPGSVVLDGDGIDVWRKKADGSWRSITGDDHESESSHTVLWQSSQARVFVLYVEPVGA